jgi:hypothetical protein
VVSFAIDVLPPSYLEVHNETRWRKLAFCFYFIFRHFRIVVVSEMEEFFFAWIDFFFLGEGGDGGSHWKNQGSIVRLPDVQKIISLPIFADISEKASCPLRFCVSIAANVCLDFRFVAKICFSVYPPIFHSSPFIPIPKDDIFSHLSSPFPSYVIRRFLQPLVLQKPSCATETHELLIMCLLHTRQVTNCGYVWQF